MRLAHAHSPEIETVQNSIATLVPTQRRFGTDIFCIHFCNAYQTGTLTERGYSCHSWCNIATHWSKVKHHSLPIQENSCNLNSAGGHSQRKYISSHNCHKKNVMSMLVTRQRCCHFKSVWRSDAPHWLVEVQAVNQ